MNYGRTESWWLGFLGATVGHYLNDELPRETLEERYHGLRESPLVRSDPDFEAALPLPKTRRGRNLSRPPAR